MLFRTSDVVVQVPYATRIVDGGVLDLVGLTSLDGERNALHATVNQLTNIASVNLCQLLGIRLTVYLDNTYELLEGRSNQLSTP